MGDSGGYGDVCEDRRGLGEGLLEAICPKPQGAIGKPGGILIV